MMGKDNLTPMEKEILEMLVERQAFASSLTPNILKIRKAIFFSKKLQQIQYCSLDGQSKLNLAVSPMTFLF